MATTRRELLKVLTAAGATAAAASRSQVMAATGNNPPVADNGLFTQGWFLESFLDLADEHEELSGRGKRLAILFEQRGCPYCRELHRVNFARPEIVSYLQNNYGVLQLDLWGSRSVTDFDGEELEERKLAQKWRVVFTPTMMFFPMDPTDVKGKSGAEAAIFQMPGYFKPFHFISMLEYVHDEHYKKEEFQRYLQGRFADLKAKGIDPDVW